MKATELHVTLRHYFRRDLSQMLAIEHDSFDWPWNEADFLGHFRQPDVIATVAEVDNRIAGYIVYQLNPKWLTLLNIAVDAQHRRCGVGRQMIEKLAAKLNPLRRSSLRLHVLETNLGGQVFFRACGFRAVAIKDKWFNTGRPAYEMRLHCEDVRLAMSQERPG